MRKTLLIALHTHAAKEFIRGIGGIPDQYIILTPVNIHDEIYKIKGLMLKPDDVKIIGDPALPWSAWVTIQAQIK